MKIHCVVIAYGLVDDLYRLFELTAAPNVHYHLFTHSDIEPVITLCRQLAWQYSGHVRMYDYRQNRGLAKSWNDGLENAYAVGADVVMLLNDDMIPAPGDLQRVARTALEMPDACIVKCRGFDLRSNDYRSMEFGFTAITRTGIERVGFFDENIGPIYWEDIDWDRRRMLLGGAVVTEERTGVVHAGSKTTVTVPGLLEFGQRSYDAGEVYYRAKWGATHHEGETYTIPFNNPLFAQRVKISGHERKNPYPGYALRYAQSTAQE